IMTKKNIGGSGDGRKFLLLVLAIFVAVPKLDGQTGAIRSSSAQVADVVTKLPEYDVVSIRPNKSGSGSVDVESNIDRYAATNISFKGLLEDAYGIKKELISGVSGPIDSARFDVVAKIIDPDPKVIRKLTNGQRQSMLLPILAERFQLEAHTEIKILP